MHRELLRELSVITEEEQRILDGRTESEVFSKTLLHSLTVFPDRRLELRLQDLPLVFHFSG